MSGGEFDTKMSILLDFALSQEVEQIPLHVLEILTPDEFLSIALGLLSFVGVEYK